MKKSLPFSTTVVRNNDLVRDSDIHKAWAMNLILAALVDPAFLSSKTEKPRLTNGDVATLVADRIADEAIVHIIESYEGEYDVSAMGVSELSRSGVTEKVIESMLSKELTRTSTQTHSAPGAVCCELIDYL
jgi:hypothetical protein